MAKIRCLDNFGNPHEFEETEYIDRESVHGVFIQDHKVLLVQDRHTKFWDFPGGGVDTGESLTEALKREFLEETAITHLTVGEKIEAITDYFYNVHSQEPWRSFRHFYMVSFNLQELQNRIEAEDIDEAELISLKKLSEYKVKPKALELISRLTR